MQWWEKLWAHWCNASSSGCVELRSSDVWFTEKRMGEDQAFLLLTYCLRQRIYFKKGKLWSDEYGLFFLTWELMHSKSKEVELDYKLPHLDCVKSKVIKASFRCLVILCKMRGSWLVNELFYVFISLKTFKQFACQYWFYCMQTFLTFKLSYFFPVIRMNTLWFALLFIREGFCI